MCFIFSTTTFVVYMKKMVGKVLSLTSAAAAVIVFYFKDDSLYVIRMNQLGIPNTLTLNISCLAFLEFKP